MKEVTSVCCRQNTVYQYATAFCALSWKKKQILKLIKEC